MKFRTEIQTPYVGDLINYQSKILTIGSCFADNIGGHLKQYEFDVKSNPFGVLFNPVSILKALKNSLDEKINSLGFLQRDDQFFHYDFHSEMHAGTADGLSNEILIRQQKTRESLQSGNVLVITFGTAWIYRNIKSNEIVANCHKIPQAEFQKELLYPENLKKDWANFLDELFNRNENLKIIVTVSPVRHIKDGLHENNISKSILLLLADHLKKTFSQVYYFPAYELIMDDLRDYRFFREDLIHPTDQAVQYVLGKFSEAYFSGKTRNAVDLKTQLIKMEEHRFLNAGESERALHQRKILQLSDEFLKLRQR